MGVWTLTLADHARRELELLGEFESSPAYAQSIVAAVAAFATYGHSGGSAEVGREHLTALLDRRALSPLTRNPDEWEDHSELMGMPWWQNQRDSRAMSNDGGTTYWYVDDGPKHLHVSIQGGPGGRRAAPPEPESDADDMRHGDVEDMLYEAWVVIANANGWHSPSEWRAAAERWRDRWHAHLGSKKPVPPAPGNDAEDVLHAEKPPGCDCGGDRRPGEHADGRAETPGA